MASLLDPQPAASSPLRVAILMGHNPREPLPEATELAKIAALDFQRSQLAVSLHVDEATQHGLERVARQGCDLLLFYGHGSEDGRLSFSDHRYSQSDLMATPELEQLWRGLRGCLVFACYGERFARGLPCPWVAFREPILTTAPRGFLHALVQALRHKALPAAIDEAAWQCGREMTGPFASVMSKSDSWPELKVAQGVTLFERSSPAISNRYRASFGSEELEGRVYPDHDPFVGRVSDLLSLRALPKPYGDSPAQRMIWVHGSAGMGKSALLREFAALVRDFEFRDEPDGVYLLHLYCFQFTRAQQVVEALCERARDLYQLDSRPSSIDELLRALEPLGGTHVWILDDLTYLSVQPDQSEEALALARAVRDTARARALPLQLVISLRQRPVSSPDFEELEVKSLSSEEACELAARCTSRENPLDALALLQAVHGSTAAFKRALLLASAQHMTLGEYASQLREWGSLEAQDQRDPTQRSLAHEVEKLGQLEAQHGFAYRTFLGLLYRVVSRAAYFTPAELESWFGDRLGSGGMATGVGYRNGLVFLLRLGFLTVDQRAAARVYTLPPNQRWNVLCLDSPESSLPARVPLRGADERLSLALERIRDGHREALAELLQMERDYSKDLDHAGAAAAVLWAMLLRAEHARGDPKTELEILGDLCSVHDRLSSEVQSHSRVAEAVVRALSNKGVRLSKLGRSEEDLSIYDLVVERFGHRHELPVAEQVVAALVNKGIRLGKLGRSEEAVAVYDRVVERFGERDELSVAALVAKAFYNKGVSLGALGRSEEEVAVYDILAERFGERDELPVAEHVAKALYNKGVSLGELGRSEEAVAVYDLVVERFGERDELPVAEPVAAALYNKGVRLGALGRTEEVVMVSDLVVERFGERAELAFAQHVAAALVNKGVGLGELGCSEEELAVYDLVVERFGERAELPIAEHVAAALFNKGVRLGELGRNEEAVAVCDLVMERFGERAELPVAQHVAAALFNKGVRLDELGRCEQAVAVYDLVVERFGQREELAVAEQVAKALYGRGTALARLARPAEAVQALERALAVSAPHEDALGDLVRAIQQFLATLRSQNSDDP